jgi:Cysteine rich repeat
MHPNICSVLAVILLLTSTALAVETESSPSKNLFQFQGTPEEQAACKPDATKFCRHAIPDSFRVLACLQEHRNRLRKLCLQVLEAHGQ